MLSDWYRAIELPVSFADFWKIPRNAAFKYEYFDGRGFISPRPRTQHALLALEDGEADPDPVSCHERIAIRPLADADWRRFTRLFAGAFRRVQPFQSLPETTALRAVRDVLGRTRTGGDGPLMAAACFVAVEAADRPGARRGRLVGAVLVTLLRADAWEPAPASLLRERRGRPHLTWIFVHPFEARLGVGTALLRAATGALRGLGYRELGSTFLVGNDSSTLWHWRSGFRLVGDPWTRRRIKDEMARGKPG